MNEYIRMGESYLRNCVIKGLAHSYDVEQKKYVKPYPEVTGYVIKYFCNNYDKLPRNIVKAGNHLVKIQDKDTGGYFSFDESNILFAFDTSQILIGLCALFEKTKKRKYLKAALKAGNFLEEMQMENGAFIPMYDKRNKEKIILASTYQIWNGPYSGLMCKLTEGYGALYDVTKEKRYLELIQKTADFYEKAEYVECSHPLGYWLEGLWRAGRKQKIQTILEEKVLSRIHENGYISYRPNLPYAYVSGTIQLGIILQKMGYTQEAEKILMYGRSVQTSHDSGGLFQYADENGNLDTHVHSEINSWGTKYFCELERMLGKSDDDK